MTKMLVPKMRIDGIGGGKENMTPSMLRLIQVVESSFLNSHPNHLSRMLVQHKTKIVGKGCVT